MILQPVTSGRSGGGGVSFTVEAECLVSDAVGDAVYIRAPRTNGRYKVAKCDPTDPAKMPTWGIITQKAAGGTDCVVQYGGPSQGIYTGLTPGRRYFVGLDGRPALPEDFSGPSPGQKHKIQTLGISLDVGVLLLKPSPDYTVRVGL